MTLRMTTLNAGCDLYGIAVFVDMLSAVMPNVVVLSDVALSLTLRRHEAGAVNLFTSVKTFGYCKTVCFILRPSA